MLMNTTQPELTEQQHDEDAAFLAFVEQYEQDIQIYNEFG